MADRQVATGVNYGPIIELKDSISLLVLVTAIRPTTGEYKGFLVDCEDPTGVAFSINGRVILVDKLRQYFTDDPMPFEIRLNGMAGRAYNYDVYRVATTWELCLAETTEKGLLNATANFVHDAIEALPPTD